MHERTTSILAHDISPPPAAFELLATGSSLASRNPMPEYLRSKRCSNCLGISSLNRQTICRSWHHTLASKIGDSWPGPSYSTTRPRSWVSSLHLTSSQIGSPGPGAYQLGAQEPTKKLGHMGLTFCYSHKARTTYFRSWQLEHRRPGVTST